MLATARELGIGFVASSPLGRGFLTGTVLSADQISENDLRYSFPRFQPKAMSSNTRVVERIREIAAPRGLTVGQLALAWLHDRGGDVIAIPGTRSGTHLEQNTRATTLVLDDENREALALAVSSESVMGDRRSPADTAMEE